MGPYIRYFDNIVGLRKERDNVCPLILSTLLLFVRTPVDDNVNNPEDPLLDFFLDNRNTRGGGKLLFAAWF